MQHLLHKVCGLGYFNQSSKDAWDLIWYFELNSSSQQVKVKATQWLKEMSSQVGGPDAWLDAKRLVVFIINLYIQKT